MRMIVWAGLAVLMSGTACLAQSTEASLSPRFRTCMANVDLGALKITQWLACYHAEVQWQDQRLNDEYRKLLARSAPASRPPLIAAERRWIDFRDAWCKFAATLDEAPSPDVNLADCLMEMTAAQADRLRTTNK